jgi:hypothetical protein
MRQEQQHMITILVVHNCIAPLAHQQHHRVWWRSLHN